MARTAAGSKTKARTGRTRRSAPVDPPPPPARRRRRWPWVLLAFFALLLSVGFGTCIWIWHWLDAPLLAPDGGARSVVILSRSSFDDVLNRLEMARVLDHPTVFAAYAWWTGQGRRLKAGTYRIPAGTTPRQLLDLLAAGAPDPYLVLTLPEGLNVWEVAEKIAALQIAPAEAVVQRASDPAFVAALGLDPQRCSGARPAWAPCLEGYLFPDTYHVGLNESLDNVLRRLVAHHRKVFARLTARYPEALTALAKYHGLQRPDVVTLASLVQAEARLADEAPLVAGVFVNRLARQIPLASDPTLVYDPARFRQHAAPVYRRDREHPFNTYQHAGLPPGPICNPGEVSLRAALMPAETPYLYFVARQDGSGSHYFSRTRAEHQAAIERYLKNP